MYKRKYDSQIKESLLCIKFYKQDVESGTKVSIDSEAAYSEIYDKWMEYNVWTYLVDFNVPIFYPSIIETDFVF